MAFQVGKPDRSSPRRPPPNYFSRSVKRRLFTMIAMVMLVLWLMDQARRPQNWYWMWGGNPQFAGGPPLTDEEMAGGRDVDTRLSQKAEQPAQPGEFVSPAVPSALEGETDAEPATEDARLERTRADAWSRILPRLGSEDDERFRALLRAAREGKSPDEATLQHWPAVLEQLEVGWDEYLQEAFQYLIDAREQLSDAQRAAWQAAVQQLEIEWRQSTKPALEAAGKGELSDAARRSLVALGEELDRIDLAAVRDNSVFRTAERHAWFRLLEKLDERTLDELESDSTGRVGFLQLFDQPEEHRGKLVTVRGTAHMAYRIQAPKNPAGVDHYYVFWIAPAGGPNSPICVYALRTPPGFPAIKDKDRDRGTTPLEVDVEFTGYFFKRWAYRAQDGLRIAPLVLAKAPRWTPPPPSLGAPAPSSPLTTAVYLLGAAAAAMTILLIAYWQGQWRSAKKRAYEMSPQRYQERLKALEENDPSEDVRETLRRLSEHPRT
jgi:hypothetical protein